MDSVGNFAIVWATQTANNTFDVHGQLFNADGTPYLNEFLVNTATTGVSNTQTSGTSGAQPDVNPRVAMSDPLISPERGRGIPSSTPTETSPTRRRMSSSPGTLRQGRRTAWAAIPRSGAASSRGRRI